MARQGELGGTVLLAKGTACVKALRQDKSYLLGPVGTVPGLDLPVWEEGGEKLAQVGQCGRI